MKLKSFKDFKLHEADEVEFTLDDTDTEVEETPVKETPVEKKPKVETTATTDASDSSTEDKYEKLKADISKMLEESGNKSDILKRAKDESVEALNIKGFNQDSDVYDFYLAHQFEIDEKLNEENFFDSKMSELGISGLYNAVIIGTQFAVKKLLEELK